ncbi:hypothetical protein EVAR_72274_1 [Eumeta japonica]|uniref:Uncharacterized protein n=1 Tax=Eumeta variegata TaxID=151549 RepID=A0A4C1T121_EUMVA|nr:hypothetical protein EVAR_72274_1 [Eumeta japonica]
MASVLINGFVRQKSYDRLIVDATLMNDFRAIVRITWLADAKEVLLIGIPKETCPDYPRSIRSDIRRNHNANHGETDISHAVVAITRHTVSCVYRTNDGENAIGRFIERAVAASKNKTTKTMHKWPFETGIS